MLTTNQKGAIAETAIAAAATRAGIEVYRPVFEGGRYDLIFAEGDRLLRVQCKWALRSGGAIAVRTQTCRRTRSGMLTRSYGMEEIDALAAYCLELDRCYLLPVEMVAERRVVHLRLTKAKNGQNARIHFAEQYELGAIAQLGERPAGSREVVGSSPTSSTPDGRPAGGLRLL